MHLSLSLFWVLLGFFVGLLMHFAAERVQKNLYARADPGISFGMNPSSPRCLLPFVSTSLDLPPMRSATLHLPEDEVVGGGEVSSKEECAEICSTSSVESRRPAENEC